MSACLQIQHVSHGFGPVPVLHDICLDVERGERLALIGPNGAGKTTLFNVLSGQLVPRAGQVLLSGRVVSGLPAHVLARAGVARSFQVSQLFGTLTVAEHVQAVVQRQLAARGAWAGLKLWRSRAQADAEQAQVDAWLAHFELTAQAHEPARALNYAQQRLLDVALAVVSGAQVLLLDEPTAGMGQSEAHRFVAQLQRVLQGQTLVFVEHDMAVAFALATRVAVLSQGRLVAVDTPEAIRQHPQVQADYLGAPHA
jgi:branched-chain amino acid transport system ATP-binding protein